MTRQSTSPGWPILRGIQNVKDIAALNMQVQSAAAALSKIWSDTFKTNAGIDAGASSGYTYRGASNFDVIRIAEGNTKALLHFNGNLTDSSGDPKTFTARNGAATDTGQKKFGSASLQLNGSTQYIDTPDNEDFEFGTGDFTIEAQCRFGLADGSYQGIARKSSAEDGWELRVAPGGGVNNVRLYASDGTQVTFSCSAMTTGVWYHIMVVRSGSALRCFLDGVKQDTDKSPAAAGYTNATATLEIGRNHGGLYFNGHLDEVRIVKGEAKQTAGFTPPSAEYSDDSAAQAIVQSVQALNLSAAVTQIMMFATVTLNSGTAAYYASTDNGSAWTQLTAAELGTLKTVPSGTQLKMKIELTADAELEDWGIAA